jgi:hypothetical protein
VTASVSAQVDMSVPALVMNAFCPSSTVSILLDRARLEILPYPSRRPVPCRRARPGLTADDIRQVPSFCSTVPKRSTISPADTLTIVLTAND